MSNLKTLIFYEYKKIFNRKSVIIGIILAFVLMVFTSVAMLLDLNKSSNYSSDTLSNYEQMLLNKEYELALTGRSLDGALILEASEAYKHVPLDIHPYDESEAYKAYARPYSSIFMMIDAAYQTRGATFDLEDFQNITQEQADSFYEVRSKQYKANLMKNPMFTDDKVNVVMSLDKHVEKPITIAFTDGYDRFLEITSSHALIIMILIVFIISPVFSDEYVKRTDRLVLSSKNGRRSFIYAKIITSITLSAVLTVGLLLTSFLVCLFSYGFEGGSSMIQNYLVMLTYDFTMLDAVGIIFVTSLFASLLMTAISLAFSSFFKKPVIALGLSMVLVISGMFNGMNGTVLSVIKKFLPTAMMRSQDIIGLQLSWHVFGVDVMLYQMVCIVAFIVSLIFISLTYFKFYNHQVS